MLKKLTFEDRPRERPSPSGIDILCTLKHFAIVTYAVPPERIKGIPERFKLNTVSIDGRDLALVSVVPFLDGNFTSAVRPFPSIKMGQTDYRTYIIDRQTGEHCVWFFGTTLDSWLLTIPKHLWKLPCYHGRVQFSCEQDQTDGAYLHYKMRTESARAPAELEICENDQPLALPGFPDVETGLVCLTDPMTGYYARGDGKIGTFCVWHEKLDMRPGTLKHAKFGLLTRMGLVHENEQLAPHSVLVKPHAEFTVYLPPKALE